MLRRKEIGKGSIPSEDGQHWASSTRIARKIGMRGTLIREHYVQTSTLGFEINGQKGIIEDVYSYEQWLASPYMQERMKKEARG